MPRTVVTFLLVLPTVQPTQVNSLPCWAVVGYTVALLRPGKDAAKIEHTGEKKLLLETTFQTKVLSRGIWQPTINLTLIHFKPQIWPLSNLSLSPKWFPSCKVGQHSFFPRSCNPIPSPCFDSELNYIQTWDWVSVVWVHVASSMLPKGAVQVITSMRLG